MSTGSKKILVTGASGYVGGRLLPLLEKSGAKVRCMARRPEFLEPKVGAGTEVVYGDVLDSDSLLAALQGIDVAYYLVHCMGSRKSFETQDRVAAENFGRAAQAAGVSRVIYLGGLGPADEWLSAHLRSRHEVGRILANYTFTTIELRASIVIGSGSLSFELIRALTEKLPVMVMPKWVNVAAQPIGIEDLLAYLMQAATVKVNDSVVVEIGGADQVSYKALMQEYARQRNLVRFMVPVPVLTPWLSSLWLGLVTPVYARIGRKLVDSLRHPTVVTNGLAGKLFTVEPRGASAAIAAALRNEDQKFAVTRWSDSLSAGGSRELAFGGTIVGSRLVDVRSVYVDAPAKAAFRPIEQIGGENGWYACNFLWRLRGFLDVLVGGVGMRRGRPPGRDLRVGDPLDFWRVERFDPPHLLLLHAEMKLPGRAWLEFEVSPEGDGARIRQTAIFYPRGLGGRLYWFAVYPLHEFVFGGMIKHIARQACAHADTVTIDESTGGNRSSGASALNRV